MGLFGGEGDKWNLELSPQYETGEERKWEETVAGGMGVKRGEGLLGSAKYAES